MSAAAPSSAQPSPSPSTPFARTEAPTSPRVRVHAFSEPTQRATGFEFSPSDVPSAVGPDGMPVVEDPAQKNLPRSKQLDPFEGFYATYNALEPPYRYEVILGLLHESGVLQAAIDAMVTNTTAFGVQFVPFAERARPEDNDAIEAEKQRLRTWFDYAGPMGTGFDGVRARVRFDFELFGDGYYEVLRAPNGDVIGVEHAMTRYLRKCKRDTRRTLAEEKIRQPDGTWRTRLASRRFRRFIQYTAYGQFVFFKEFGDPRKIRADNGHEDPNAEYGDLATEIINLSRYAGDFTYGRPRWRGEASSILGRSAAGSVNSDVFDNKAIPPLLITVQGASLDDAAVERIRDHFLSSRGRDRWHAPLIIEAETKASSDPSDPLGISKPGQVPRIDVKDLTESVQKDAAFLGYRAASARDVAMSMRLPPIFLGIAAEYNFATAQAARQVAEEQVFQPERQAEDVLYNQLLLPYLDARWCKLVTKAPPLLTEETLLKVINVGIASGALTVNNVVDLLEPLLGKELSTSEAWRNLPASVFQSLAKSGVIPAEVAEHLGETVKALAGASGQSPQPPGGDSAGTQGTGDGTPAEGGDGTADGTADTGDKPATNGDTGTVGTPAAMVAPR